jgi:hypothetical protein
VIFTRIPTIFIDFANTDLNRGMVLRFDDAVGSAAFARNIAGLHKLMFYVEKRALRHEDTYRSTTSPFSFSMTAIQDRLIVLEV